MTPRTRRAKMKLAFARKLVLNRWVLGEFGFESFADLSKALGTERREGRDESNVHWFHHDLCHIPPGQRPRLPDDVLLAYDQAIVSVTRRLNESRLRHGKRRIQWKYFQYLSLLFTEIYLERYFTDPEGLRDSLNDITHGYNEALPAGHVSDRLESLQTGLDPRGQLNKLAFWMATGSGKTLLMHAHILRYRELARKYGPAHHLNRVLLLTPNEGLSRQHLEEFEIAGIPASIFSKDGGGLFDRGGVEILDVHKLADDMGDKTVAVSALEGPNLVLIDEGHRGASSGKRGAWMGYRNQLCEGGFSFEYSATFGQAIKGDRELTAEYARSTLVDYSYRWFHGDGFGKEYRIANIDEDSGEWRTRYLTAALLTFFQQQWLYGRHGSAFGPYNIEPPLWVFVGSKVTKSLSVKDASDIVEILRFLDGYLSEREVSVERIRRVLLDDMRVEHDQLRLPGDFNPLLDAGLNAEQIYRETLATTFNAPSGGTLRVERLKGSAGELALRVGETNEPFGVVNVGDSGELKKKCEDAGLIAREREFADSVFHKVNEPDSRINVLVGAKKFTEGWNSWRVSSMGLMNVGKSEGSQIIQLFGRGVRLKGQAMSLKRSAADRSGGAERRPTHLDRLETLHVFGVKADYMAQFRDFLKDEGLAVDPVEEFIPISVPHLPSGLKVIRVAESVSGGDPSGAFRRSGPRFALRTPWDEELPVAVRSRLGTPRVPLDWRPRVQTIRSEELDGWGEDPADRNEEKLLLRHLALVDLDTLCLSLQRFKRDRGWHSLAISKSVVNELLRVSDWYRLLIPPSELRFDSMRKARMWQDIALALLKKYVTRYWGARRQAWEAEHLEYSDLKPSDGNFPRVMRDGDEATGYKIVIAADQRDAEELRDWIKAVRQVLESGGGSLPPNPVTGQPALDAVAMDQHLYSPLLVTVHEQAVTVSPPGLNAGEHQFAKDFRAHSERVRREGQRLHLLRNMSRGHGIGFFEANNFHPDFILWAVSGDRQHIAFIDPKGLVRMDADDPKVRLATQIKEIEKRLGDPNVRLDSFILSVTPFETVSRSWDMSKAEMAERHVLFMGEDRATYVGEMLRRMGVA